MASFTSWIIFCVVLNLGKSQNVPQLGCPRDCKCEDLSATNSAYKVVCDKFPNEPLPARTSILKSTNCPVNLTMDMTSPINPKFVTNLDLSGGKIETVGDYALSQFNRALIIDLSNNNIHTIGPKTLTDCFNLQELRLSNNHIKNVNNQCFKSTIFLKNLFLDHNEITTLPLFPPKLENLDISHNPNFHTLPSMKLRELVSLNVCGNDINQVLNFETPKLRKICMSKILPINLDQIETLNLEAIINSVTPTRLDLKELKDANLLKNLTIDKFFINSFAFPNFAAQRLTNLALHKVTFEDNAGQEFLNHLPKTALESIDLSNSPQPAQFLEESDASFWDKMHSLSHINLRSCGLKSLGNIQASTGQQLNVEWGDNPIECDCNLSEKLKVGQNIQLIGEVPFCESPIKFKGQSIDEALPFLCDQELPEEDIEVKGGNRDEIPPSTITEETESTKISTETESTTITETASTPILEKDFDDDWGEIENNDTTEQENEHTTEVNELEGLDGEPESNTTTYIIIGVVFLLAFLGAILFSVLFFYFRRRGHANVEVGPMQYSKKTSSRDNLVK